MGKILLFVILCFYLYHLCYGELCSANANMHWRRSKSKCVKCRGCPFGSARNLSEEYRGRTGEHGDERCLPCRPPPDGYFVAENMFKPCVVNCTHNNRMAASLCSSTRDSVCGSCLPGFEDAYEIIELPCLPKKKAPDPVVQSPVTFDQTTPTPIGSPPTKTPTTLKKTEQMPSKDVNQGDVDQGGVDQGDVNQGGVSSPESHPKLLLYIGFPVVTLIPLLLAFVHLVKSEQRFKKARSDVRRSEEDIPLTGIEVDGPKDNTEPKTVVGGGTLSGGDTPTPETGTKESPGVYTAHGNSYDEKCQCNRQQNVTCDCPDTNSSDYMNRVLTKDDGVIDTVAEYICHNPVIFFDSIGVPDGTYYQLNVEHKMRKEFYSQCIRRWIEVKGQAADLKALQDGLCKGNFHCINELISGNIDTTYV